MKTSESIKNLAGDLKSAVQHIQNVAPNKQGYGYKYADLAHIIDECKQPLLDHNLIAIQSITQSEQSVGITTRIQHTSGEYIEDTFDLPAADVKGTNAVQKIGASITYGRRYGLAAMLGIAVDEDVDGKTQVQHRKPDFTYNEKLFKLIKENADCFTDDEKKQFTLMIHYSKNGYTKEIDKAEYDRIKAVVSLAVNKDFKDDELY